MKSFDLCMKPRSLRDAAALAAVAAVTKVGGVAVEAPRDKLGEYMRVFRDAGLEALPRITFRVRRASEIAPRAAEARRVYAIVAVEAENDEAFRYAARDSNVDLVVFKPGQGRLIDSSQAYLLRLGGGAVEVQLPRLIDERLRSAMVAARRAVAYNVPLVVSTCASTIYEYMPPRALEAMLKILGVPGSYAKAFVYGYPWGIVRRRLHAARGSSRGVIGGSGAVGRGTMEDKAGRQEG